MARRATTVLAAVLVAGAFGAAVAAAAPRTFRVSAPADADSDGASGNPQINATGRFVAYESAATNLAPDPDGPVRDIFVTDTRRGTTRLVSYGLAGAGADGPSFDPALNHGGGIIAFASNATNLVNNDLNGVEDVFVQKPSSMVRASVAASSGGDANGPSTEPDISADGRYVAFVSSATNLVSGDTNGVADVFVRDLVLGLTARVSVGPGGRQANGPSGAPAISADGHVVSFASAADNLVSRDSNHVRDVFVRDSRRHRTEIVSVSSTHHQQDRAVAAPFQQVSDLSADGRYVVFDSDATNLVPGDANRRTDVFVRDRLKRLTRLESENSAGFQGDNDSFLPAITPNARLIAFASFASNLVGVDAPGQDTFVRDARANRIALIDVGASGQRRGPERRHQLLERPSVSDGGRIGVFTSTANGLVPGDHNGLADVFVRILRYPRR